MGFAKVEKISDHEVRFVHQLDNEGKPYAEDVILKLDESVDPSRLAYLAGQEGKVGTVSYSFRATERPESVRFPGEEADG